LTWPGKTTEVERSILPFQSIEQIDEPRSETVTKLDLFSVDQSSGRQAGGWTNKLIWGDNKLILSSLVNGPMRAEVEAAGGLKLVYIDPPFDVGADFAFEVDVGEGAVTKAPTVVEEYAYRDTWGRGRDSYLAMIYERLALIRALLAPEGSIWVHLDWRVGYFVKCLLDELFGPDAFRNDVIWSYGGSGRGAKAIAGQFPRNHDMLLWYSRSKRPYYVPQYTERRLSIEQARKAGLREDEEGRWFKTAPRGDYTDASIAALDKEGRVHRTRTGGLRIKYFLRQEGDSVVEDVLVGDTWSDIPDAMHLPDAEKTDYATQKPERLLARLMAATTEPGDLVGDFFCGSGTALAVAEKLRRKWIGADLGRFAIHTSRKRLIGVQRESRSAGEPFRAFEILNLGSYERQFFAGTDPSLPEHERAAASEQRLEQYVNLILSAYSAERSEQLPPFHGVKGRAAVLVGPLDAPVTQSEVRAAIDAARDAGIARVDILGFEFEMGIKPAMADEARDEGITLALRYIRTMFSTSERSPRGR
jgi:adenine-specific DNA-methyltransferase